MEHLPPPSGEPEAPLKALVFDAQYDVYRGIVLSCRIHDGSLAAGDRVRFMHAGTEYEVHEVGYSGLRREKADRLPPGRSATSSPESRPSGMSASAIL